MAGEVVGVNSMAARNGSIGFAIPSNLVKRAAAAARRARARSSGDGSACRIAEIGDDDWRRLSCAEAKGVLIRQVVAGQPADQGGVKADDVIIALDGTPIDEPRDLQRVVSSTPVGKRVRVVVLRAGEQKEMDVTIGRYKEREKPTR